jgi:hypothetical protein
VQKLAPDRLEKFNGALLTVGMSKLDIGSAIAGKTTAPADMTKNMKAELDGKTAEEVIAAADKIDAERKARERAAAAKEVESLLHERDAANAAKAELAKFGVLRAHFSKEKNVLGLSEPRIEMRVKNGTATPVSRAYFVGVVSSPGRSIPWLKETFNYEIRGGLEPGEEATWQLAPNMFSPWGTTDVPADAGLSVTVVQLDGPDGKPLYSILKFTENDAARLAALQKEFGK